jgi:hypothetical protein
VECGGSTPPLTARLDAPPERPAKSLHNPISLFSAGAFQAKLWPQKGSKSAKMNGRFSERQIGEIIISWRNANSVLMNPLSFRPPFALLCRPK